MKWYKYWNKFHSSALKFEAKCWLYLINNRLLPSHNTSEVNIPRGCLIWCFMTGRPVDMARVIHEEMFVRSKVKRYGFFYPSLVTRLCLTAKVQGDFAVDGRVPTVYTFRADTVTTGKDVVDIDKEVEDDSDDDDGEQEHKEEQQVHMEEEPAIQEPAAEVEDPSRARRSYRLDHLERDLVGPRTSVADLGTRVDAIAIQQAKSEKKFMGWLRVLGRACHVNPETVSDQE